MRPLLKYFLVFSLIPAFMMSCEPEPDLVIRFEIEQNEHYSSPRMARALQSNTLVFRARFNSTAKYDLGSAYFQDSKNKLLGFSDCNSDHHENSARFAWQWNEDRLEIFAYCYVDGQRVERFIRAVELDEFSTYSLSMTESEYIFSIDASEPMRIPRGNVCETGLYYMLWPYFGGTLPAPHDVAIDIQL
jgi:hypothetical protein